VVLHHHSGGQRHLCCCSFQFPTSVLAAPDHRAALKAHRGGQWHWRGINPGGVQKQKQIPHDSSLYNRNYPLKLISSHKVAVSLPPRYVSRVFLHTPAPHAWKRDERSMQVGVAHYFYDSVNYEDNTHDALIFVTAGCPRDRCLQSIMTPRAITSPTIFCVRFANTSQMDVTNCFENIRLSPFYFARDWFACALLARLVLIVPGKNI
jgi:hypothetical protein